MTGNRQSGMPLFRLGEGVDAERFLHEAHSETLRLTRDRPDTVEHQPQLRRLLQIFDRNDTQRINRAG